jgi:hypothetical protein
MTHFNPLAITLSVYSHSQEILATSEVPRGDSLFTAIAKDYPFASWHYADYRESGKIGLIYDSGIGSEEVTRAWLQFLGDKVKNARYPRKLAISVVLKDEEDNATAPRSQSSSFDVVDSATEWEQQTPLPSSVQVLGTMSSLLLHS